MDVHVARIGLCANGEIGLRLTPESVLHPTFFTMPAIVPPSKSYEVVRAMEREAKLEKERQRREARGGSGAPPTYAELASRLQRLQKQRNEFAENHGSAKPSDSVTDKRPAKLSLVSDLNDDQVIAAEHQNAQQEPDLCDWILVAAGNGWKRPSSGSQVVVKIMAILDNPVHEARSVCEEASGVIHVVDSFVPCCSVRPEFLDVAVTRMLVGEILAAKTTVGLLLRDDCVPDSVEAEHTVTCEFTLVELHDNMDVSWLRDGCVVGGHASGIRGASSLSIDEQCTHATHTQLHDSDNQTHFAESKTPCPHFAHHPLPPHDHPSTVEKRTIKQGDGYWCDTPNTGSEVVVRVIRWGVVDEEKLLVREQVREKAARMHSLKTTDLTCGQAASTAPSIVLHGLQPAMLECVGDGLAERGIEIGAGGEKWLSEANCNARERERRFASAVRLECEDLKARSLRRDALLRLGAFVRSPSTLSNYVPVAHKTRSLCLPGDATRRVEASCGGRLRDDGCWHRIHAFATLPSTCCNVVRMDMPAMEHCHCVVGLADALGNLERTEHPSNANARANPKKSKSAPRVTRNPIFPSRPEGISRREWRIRVAAAKEGAFGSGSEASTCDDHLSDGEGDGGQAVPTSPMAAGIGSTAPPRVVPGTLWPSSSRCRRVRLVYVNNIPLPATEKLQTKEMNFHSRTRR